MRKYRLLLIALSAIFIIWGNGASNLTLIVIGSILTIISVVWRWLSE